MDESLLLCTGRFTILKRIPVSTLIWHCVQIHYWSIGNNILIFDDCYYK